MFWYNLINLNFSYKTEPEITANIYMVITSKIINNSTKENPFIFF